MFDLVLSSPSPIHFQEWESKGMAIVAEMMEKIRAEECPATHLDGSSDHQHHHHRVAAAATIVEGDETDEMV